MSTIERRFEGRERLDKLLTQAGSIADSQDVVEAFADALGKGVPVQVVIQALFEDEPRFPSPADAAALYGNLLGLWDAVEAGTAMDLLVGDREGRRERAPKPPVVPPPGLFPKEGPSEEWLEVAWRYIEGGPKKDLTRLEHAFENRQDALLTWLDESGAANQVYGAARQILFELFAMLELGTAAGVGRLDSSSLTGDASGADVPHALAAWAQEAVFQAATDEAGPLADEEAARLKLLVDTALKALWARAATGVKDAARKTRR